MAWNPLALGFSVTALVQGITCYGIVALFRSYGRVGAAAATWLTVLTIFAFTLVGVGSFFLLQMVMKATFAMLVAAGIASGLAVLSFVHERRKGVAA